MTYYLQNYCEERSAEEISIKFGSGLFWSAYMNIRRHNCSRRQEEVIYA